MIVGLNVIYLLSVKIPGHLLAVRKNNCVMRVLSNSMLVICQLWVRMLKYRHDVSCIMSRDLLACLVYQLR